MRILHVSSTSTVSGANRYAFDLAAGQKDLGHDPVVAMPANPGAAFKFAREDVERISLGNPRFFSFLAAVRRAKADILHCHDGTVARWARFVPSRPPALVTLHIRYKPSAMSHFDGVHVLADWQAKGLNGFAGKVAQIGNWVPKIAEADSESTEAARKKAGAKPDDFLVVFLGRLERVKGVDLLIDAVRSLPDKDLKVAIVGGGEDEQEIRDRASGEPRILFAGYSDRPAEWYGAADVVVMPSRSEPFALVALEAMACGAPILASNVDGFGEIFRDKPELLVPTEDPASLAAAIARRKAAKTSAGPVRLRYDMSRFQRPAGIAAVTRFYDEVISHKRSSG